MFCWLRQNRLDLECYKRNNYLALVFVGYKTLGFCLIQQSTRARGLFLKYKSCNVYESRGIDSLSHRLYGKEKIVLQTDIVSRNSDSSQHHLVLTIRVFTKWTKIGIFIIAGSFRGSLFIDSGFP